MEELRYFTWMSECIPKGNIAINHILERYSTAKEFYNKCQSNISGMDFLSEQLKSRIKKTDISVADEILNKCERMGIKTICCSDELFPQKLLDIDGIPPVLYYVGDISILNDTASLCVVGTRKALDKSKQITGNICKILASVGITIISGCAVGIDEYSHRGAIKVGGKTVGILGCGINVNYPRRNARIKNKLLKLGGALISEQPPDTKPVRINFPCRNRLLAGLADSVFVVEAPKKSGSLITAEQAVIQGKDVFCLPPLEYNSKRFSGCVKYLRSGAIAVYDVSDILFKYYMDHTDKLNSESIIEILEQDDPLPQIFETVEDEHKNSFETAVTAKILKKRKIEGVSDIALKLYDIGLSFEPKRIEQLAEETDMSVPEILSALTELEIFGAVSQKAGNMYYIQA